MRGKDLLQCMECIDDALIEEALNPAIVSHKNKSAAKWAMAVACVMAVDELKDYLENGNIRNSVNYPACDMGVCNNVGRVAILHRNIANMITQFTAAFGAAGINISDMTNKSRGEYAYTMMDIEKSADEKILEQLNHIDGVFRVRVVK